MLEVLIPAIPRHHHLGVGAAVVAGEGLHHVGIGVLFGELGAVDSGRVSAPLRVHVEPGVAHLPHHRVHAPVPPFTERELGVVDEDLVAPQGRRGAALPARGPRAVPQAFRVRVANRDACDRVGVVVRHDCRDRGVHHERDEEQESEYRNDCSSA